MQQVDEPLREQRRVLGRLEDDGVAADERRADFQAGIAIGKFHGVIAPTTPTGMRTLILNLSCSSDGVVWPKSRRPSPPM